MATHDYVIANGTGAAVRSDLNNALAAIVSNNSSSSEPGTTYAYQWWADTNANVLKIRNSSNDGWITLRELDGTMLIEDGSASTPGLAFADDVNTGIFSPAADQIGFATGGAERLEIGSSEVVFNDPSNDVDFRVESNGNTHMLFVDAGNDRVGIGTDAPGAKFSVFDSSSAQFRLETPGVIAISHTFDGTDYTINNNDGSSGHPIIFGTKTSGAESLRIDASGRLLINTTSATQAHPLQVTASSSSAEAIVINARSSDEIGELSFFESDKSTRQGEIQYRADHVNMRHRSGDIRFATGGITEQMRLDSSGRLMLGTTTEGYSGAQTFTIAESGNAGITIRSGTSNNGTIAFSDATSGDGEFDGFIQYSQNHQRFDIGVSSESVIRIRDTGGFENYSTSTNIDLSNSRSAGSTYEFIYARHSATALTTGTLSFRVTNNGNVTNTNNSYGSLSDQRLKENIVDAASQWDDIKGLQVRKYNFREATGYQTHTQIGLIAQEAESVSPGLVQTSPVKEGETVLDANGNELESVKSINYSVLYMKAVKALQEAQTRIETLETKVAALEAG